MDGWRAGRLVMLIGGLGVLLGAVLAAAVDDSSSGFLDRSTTGSVALSLLLVGLAAWHFWAWGFGKLVAIGLLAAGALQFTLYDFGDGTPLWEAHTGTKLAAGWLVVGSAAVMLAGVLWSFVELTPSPEQRSEDTAASVAWWRKWGILVAGGFVALWVIGQLFADTDDAIDISGEGEDGQLSEDEWSITPDGDAAGSYIFSMVRTFSPMEQADVEDLGGRLIWPETEVELCDVGIWAAGEGFVQVGIVSPTTEGCPGTFEAFEDYGLPETACLFVRSDGVDDEYCAPLTVDREQREWRIDLDDATGVHTVFMIQTFGPLEEADVEDLGGRLVWPGTEVELCNVEIRSVGDGFVEIGDVLRTNEGCSGMREAFEDFGVPETGCLFVRSDGVDDEYCAPFEEG